MPKEWFYDDMDMNDVDSLEEPKSPADDEYDYDPRYGNKKGASGDQASEVEIPAAVVVEEAPAVAAIPAVAPARGDAVQRPGRVSQRRMRRWTHRWRPLNLARVCQAAMEDQSPAEAS